MHMQSQTLVYKSIVVSLLMLQESTFNKRHYFSLIPVHLLVANDNVTNHGSRMIAAFKTMIYQ